jgi:hypothetical protein
VIHQRSSHQRFEPARAGALVGSAILVACLAACMPSAANSTPPGSGASASPGGTAPAATATSAPALRFTFGDDVVVDTRIAGTDDLYINPGAVIEDAGVLHMFANSFSTWPGRVSVPHLTSEDGTTWTLVGSAPVLSSDDVALANPGIDVSTGFVADDGTWVLVFETVSSSTPWVLGRATAPSPDGPWTVDDEPILTQGAPGTFDAGGLHWPSVVRTDAGYLLFYAGFDVAQSGSGAIGLATSSDGVTWDKRPEPVLAASEPWEGRSLDRPRAVVTPDGLAMVYAGRDLSDRGLATSGDGVTWTKRGAPVIERDDFPIPARAWDAALLYRGGDLEYFLEIGGQTTKVYRATLPWDR